MSICRTAAKVLIVGGFLLSISPAFAADTVELPQEAPQPDAKEWTFTVAPYMWAAGLKGDVGLFGREPIDIDMSFGDVLDSLRFGGMMVVEAHNGTWGIFGDLIYVKTEADESISRNILGVATTLGATVETDSLTATLMGEYRAYSTEAATVDLMGGLRIWSVDNDISVRLNAGGATLAAFSGSDGSDWVDPIFGVKARFNTGTPWYFTAWGMVGGFGAGSDLTWDVLGGVGYQWNDWLSTVGGYRALGVDYDDDGFVYDVVQHGLFFGAVMQF